MDWSVNHYVQKFQINGKNVYIVGGLHFPGKMEEREKKAITDFLPLKEMNPNNTLSISEGNGIYSLSWFLSAGTAPASFEKIPNIQADTIRDFLTALYISKKLHNRAKKKYGPRDVFEVFEEGMRLRLETTQFREFKYATMIKELSGLKEAPKNVVFFVGFQHAKIISRFLSDEKHYLRYKDRLQKLAREAYRKYLKHVKYIEKQKQRVRRISKKNNHALSIRGAKK